MSSIEQRAEAVRAFNRFYTRRIGALGEGHLGSDFSLTEVRVLYELAHRDAPTAGDIAEGLGLDKTYLSRTLRSFKTRGLLQAKPASDDARRKVLELTAKGRRAFAPLDDGAREEIVQMLRPLAASEQSRLLEAMRSIRGILGDPDAQPDRSQPFVIRPHRAGDMGWVVHRHGVLYSEEYGWDERFEALVAGVVSQFIKDFDPERERCWIAERDGEIVGSIFCVAKNKTTAQLRLLLVEPSARGLGIGARLVDEVIRFAKQVGYKRLELWTQRNLTSARRIYKAAGFEITGTEGHEYFGVPLQAESWGMELR
ncbi:MAG TPA: helix-turn-helix domain-containing GNAT family N-acetyltransferase [Gemmatimonadaceae bacterium]|nr:helix-turn-helix domain-containing GNAT family N-acetyltransferase [Gemmatimonadaceae bacterium]